MPKSTRSNKGYNGNALLPLPNEIVSLTQAELAEYVKCAEDVKYFINNYVKIVHVDHGIVPFKMWPFQETIIDVFEDNRFVICKMARQSGKSTVVVCGYFLWYVLFHPDVSVGILANKENTAIELLRRLKQSFEYLPAFLKQGIVKWDQKLIMFANNSRVRAESTSASAIRGDTFNCIAGKSNVDLTVNGLPLTLPIETLYQMLANSSRYENIETGDILLDDINYDIFEQQMPSKNGQSQRSSVEQRPEIYIRTDTGYQRFIGIRKTSPQKTLRIQTVGGRTLECTPDHKIMTPNGWIVAQDIAHHSVVVNGVLEQVSSVTPHSTQPVYDMLEVAHGHRFYANDILVSNCLFLDEFAHVPDNIAGEFMTSVFPAISSGKTTKLFVISTPKGYNLFYKIWNDSEEGRNTYKTIGFTWRDVPGRDDTWAEETRKNIGEQQFEQEFETSFQGSANTLIPAYKLAQMSYKTPVEERGPLKVYVPPIRANETDPSHVYLITVDTSQGQEQDFAVANVFDISVTPFRQVAVYRQNDLTPQLFAPIIKQIGQYYCNAFVLIEINDVGLTVADSLRMELEYENLIYIRSDPKKGQMLGGGFSPKARPGLRVTLATKRIGCAQLRTMIEKDQLLLFDYQTIRELTTFVAKGANYQAEEGAHDDCVMTLVLLGWLAGQHGFENYVGLSMRKMLMNQADPVSLDEPFSGFFDMSEPPLNWDYPEIVEDPDFWKS